ncbi:hypothetical protein AAVH_19758, partial [Aphelenchoides avenae]
MTRILEARSVLKEVPPSQAVQERVANAVANVSSKLTSLLWKHRPAIYDSVIRDVVQKLKLDYNGGDNGNVDGVMYLPYETSSKSVHCAYAVDSGNYSASVDDVANFIVQYTWPVAVAQALKD